MTKIKEILDRSACAAWCPVASHPDVVVLGSKDSGGVGFEDTGGELELYDLNLSSSSQPQQLASVKTAARFASVDWSPYKGDDSNDGEKKQQYPLGLIAGGMTDGTVHIWDASALLLHKTTSPLFTLQQHANGPVAALKFQPIEPWKVATGGSDGRVLVFDLSSSSSSTTSPPTVLEATSSSSEKQSAEITAVAWNSQVAHILASASRDGSVVVWDLTKQKAWCKLQVEHGAVNDCCWNPKEGLHLLTASGDDRNPVIKVWDLGASTTMPLMTVTGHAAGILKTSWCPHDDTLLLSCAKDNRTLLWDLTTLQPVGEIPYYEDDNSEQQQQQPKASPNQLFSSSSLDMQKHTRVLTAWSPLKRGIALTCSLDRKVQVHSVLGLATQSGRPPKWMKPASLVTTAFGGAVISANVNNKVVTIRTVQEQPLLAKTSQLLEHELASTNLIAFCDKRRAAAKKGSADEKTWGFMRIIFEANARQELLSHLGFDANEIARAASQYQDDAAANGVGSMSLDDKNKALSSSMSKSAEEMVKKALIVGNFEAAVECCFQTGNLADALLLASCGGAELWSKTQERYFEKESAKRPYLSLVSGIVRSQLDDIVAESDTSNWQETLAILSTYGESDQFPQLCIALGDRLEEAGDSENASLCYLCSFNLERSAIFWKSQFEKANKARGTLDILALHEFVVKVSVFLKAAGSTEELPSDIADLFSKYAQALSEQGLLVTAAKYSKGTSMESKILRDRLYRSRDSQKCLAELGSAPDFPFTMETVQKSRGQAQTTRRTQTTSRAQTSAQYSQSGGASAVPAAPVQQTSQGDQLPAGWTALQDPASGRTYYANQTTGETTWDRPQAAPEATPSSQHSYATAQTTMDSSAHSQQAQQTSYTPATPKTPTKAHLVSKYGDGFVTSASHPELADQYGNHGTSNPYTGVSRPGTAAAVVKAERDGAPTSDPIDINNLELSAEHAQLRDTLLGLYEYLHSVARPSDKRQLDETKKGIEVLVKRLSRGALEEGTVAQVVAMVAAVSNRDSRTATSIQTALASHSHDWKSNKDWLKGMKCLIQLASKYLPSS